LLSIWKSSIFSYKGVFRARVVLFLCVLKRCGGVLGTLVCSATPLLSFSSALPRLPSGGRGLFGCPRGGSVFLPAELPRGLLLLASLNRVQGVINHVYSVY